MNYFIVLIGLIFFWSLSDAYSIRKLRIRPPPAKYGFDPSMGEQDGIGSFNCLVLFIN